MKLKFYKYQGTGNDFVMIDNRDQQFPKNDTRLVFSLCDRRFGIGADGLILLENHPDHDFSMVYYNSDGKLSTMCGNGGRCITAFAQHLGVIQGKTKFMAVDGVHTAEMREDGVALGMNDVEVVEIFDHYCFLNTGSPHHVQLVEGLDRMDVYKEGARIRYGKYGKEGSNVNFVERRGTDKFAVRTYERGVEDETWSCGTGVTAVAIAMHALSLTSSSELQLLTRGGDLTVSFTPINGAYKHVVLKGPATLVFEGFVDRI